MQKLKMAALVAWLVLATGAVQATPGDVDAKGCHQSKKIGFHCHPTRVRDLRLDEHPKEPPNNFVGVQAKDCKRDGKPVACKGHPKK